MDLEKKINSRYIFLDGSNYGDVMGVVSKESNYRPASIGEAMVLFLENPLLRQEIISTGDGLARCINEYGDVYLKVDSGSQTLSDIIKSTKHDVALPIISDRTYSEITENNFYNNKKSITFKKKKQAKKNPLLSDLLGVNFIEPIVEKVYSENGIIEINLGKYSYLSPTNFVQPVYIKANGSTIVIDANLGLNEQTTMPVIRKTSSFEITRFRI